jgi:hypothetical protein
MRNLYGEELSKNNRILIKSCAAQKSEEEPKSTVARKRSVLHTTTKRATGKKKESWESKWLKMMKRTGEILANTPENAGTLLQFVNKGSRS